MLSTQLEPALCIARACRSSAGVDRWNCCGRSSQSSVRRNIHDYIVGMASLLRDRMYRPIRNCPLSGLLDCESGKVVRPHCMHMQPPHREVTQRTVLPPHCGWLLLRMHSSWGGRPVPGGKLICKPGKVASSHIRQPPLRRAIHMRSGCGWLHHLDTLGYSWIKFPASLEQESSLQDIL